MDIPLDKVIPRALALAVVVYCLWPSLTEFFAKPRPPAPATLPELTASLLSPTLPPLPTQNPFAEEAPAEAPAATSANAIQSVLKSAPRGGSTQPVESKSRTVAAGRQVITRSGEGERPAAKLSERAGPRPVLEATCIVGERRLAVIDGRVYAPNDKASLPGLSATPCEVVGVLPYKVLLKCGDQRLELTYSDAASKSASAARPSAGKKPAKRAAPTKAKTTKK